MTHLTAISGKDGEVLLRPVNPHYLFENQSEEDEENLHEAKSNLWHRNFENTVKSYPTHGFTLKPGDRILIDEVKLEWFHQTLDDPKRWKHFDTNYLMVEDIENGFINCGGMMHPVRQAYVKVTPKPPQQKDVALLDKEQGQNNEIGLELDYGIKADFGHYENGMPYFTIYDGKDHFLFSKLDIIKLRDFLNQLPL